MTDRSPIWIGLADLLLCVVSVALVCVNPPSTAKGVERKAEFLLTATWSATLDADVDLWAIGPSQKPVFYGARDVGCARYEQDDRGFLDGHVTLTDGTQAAVPEFRETITLRCLESGHWDVAVHLFGYKDDGSYVSPTRHGLDVRVHVELVALNPSYRVLDTKDVVLDRVSQSVNTVSFDLARDGMATLADPPLGLLVEKFQKATP
jgi:hypothetical protein